jgi:single-strand DNA-binding protein
MSHQVINHVTLRGRVANDPTLVGDDIAVRFDLAVTEVSVVDGERTEHTDWHTVVCWESLVGCCKHLRKGDRVGVVGLLRSKTWKAGDIDQRVTEVHATRIELSAGDDSAFGSDAAGRPLAGDFGVPKSRCCDFASLARQIRIDNRHLHGQAVFVLAQELFKIEFRTGQRTDSKDG